MIVTSVVTAFHFIGIILLFVSLSVELLLLKTKLTYQEASKISKADMLYGVASVLIFTTGLLKIFYFGKGSGYYLNNYLMWSKLALFTVVGALSIYPTIFFIKWRKKIKQKESIAIDPETYQLLKRLIHSELMVAILIPFLATLMARGIGFFG